MSENAREEFGWSYKPIESLRRGLSILRCINQEPTGSASITSISQATGLHRTTVRRMLETLQNEGYVRRNQSDEHYRLSSKVRQLSEGFTEEDWVSEIAADVMVRLQRKVVWPSDLCVLDGDCMVVRESTHRLSPLSFHRGMIHREMPILFTAVGRAYLGACPVAECEEILQMLRHGNDEQSHLARNTRLVESLLHRTRQQGFGENDGDWRLQKKVRSIALPVRHEGRVLGCINIVFMKTAMSISDAATRLLPHLQDAVGEIEQRLVARNAAAMQPASRWRPRASAQPSWGQSIKHGW